MKKLKKLSLENLAQEAITLSIEQQMEVYAGTGIDGLCYFESLEILSGIYGCNYSESYYINSYASTHGGYSAIMTSSNNQVTFNGVAPNDAISYLTTQFSASSVGISGYSTALANGNSILTDMQISPGVSHAVVITGYDSSTGKYIYKDANGTGEASASQFNTSFSMAVNSGIPH